MNYANAFEFSLKFMETCYMVAERFSSADFLHGPIAMIERDFPVILFAPPGKTLAGQRVTHSTSERAACRNGGDFVRAVCGCRE